MRGVPPLRDRWGGRGGGAKEAQFPPLQQNQTLQHLSRVFSDPECFLELSLGNWSVLDAFMMSLKFFGLSRAFQQYRLELSNASGYLYHFKVVCQPKLM